MYVKCCDTNGACAVKYITVNVDPVVVDAAFASSVNAERVKRMEMKDFAGASGKWNLTVEGIISIMWLPYKELYALLRIPFYLFWILIFNCKGVFKQLYGFLI